MGLRTALSRLQLLTAFCILVAAVAPGPLHAAEGKPLTPYSVLVIQSFTVNSNVNAAGMPPGYEEVLQKTLFARLLSDRVFERVEEAGPAAADPTEPGTLIASGEISDFSKGNRAARLAVGYGAGSAKIKIIMIFRDGLTGKEVLRLERTGRYAGFGNVTGGSADKARSESARKVVDALVKEIKAAR